MIRNIYILLLLSLSYSQPEIEWSQIYDGVGFGDIAYSVQETTDGGYILVGLMCQTTDVQGFCNSDVWLIKTDSEGHEEWSQTFGDDGEDVPRQVKQTSDGGYIIVGWTDSYGDGDLDSWVIKTDDLGVEEWSEIYGGIGIQKGFSIDEVEGNWQNPEGYIILVEDYYCIRIIKIDYNGNQQWTQAFGGPLDKGYSIELTSDSGYIISGYQQNSGIWLIKTDNDGVSEWDKSFQINEEYNEGLSVQQTDDGGYIIAGSAYPNGWLIKTDLGGVEEWNYLSGSIAAYSVDQTDDNGYIFTARAPGNSDIWVEKIDHNGNQEWTQIFGGSGNDIGYSIKQTSDGGYIIAGGTSSDIWLFKLAFLYGCTDPYASNYNPDADVDDGSCEYAPHFIPETGGFPNGAMGIYITDIDIDPSGGCGDGLGEEGGWYIFCDSLAVPWMEQDEIAVFDGYICVGSAKNESGADSLQIFVYEDNPSTPEQDGYIAGGELSFKYWHHRTQTELTNLHANYNPDWGEEPTTYYFEPFGVLNAEFDVYFLNGCTDVEACNYYDSLVTIDDGSCATMEELGWCDCEGSIIDECGVCGGSGIPWGECDCDGNELDCEGVCGGGAIIDECGVCNGEDIECWDGSFVCDEASCPTPNTGDMNTDGLLNILDVIILLNWILDDEPYIEYGDLNDDEYNNIIDIVLLVNWILDGVTVCEGVEDIDGNCYETIQIGNQLWMAENLKVTHYNDGSEIPYPSNEDWGSYNEGQYGVYESIEYNDPGNADIYGNLYNFAVVDDDRGVCPEGWHVPSDEEYTILADYLGGELVAGGKMKSTGTGIGVGLWNEPNEGATNESGFTGLPAGFRSYTNGYYHAMGEEGRFWSSSETDSSNARFWFLDSNYSSVIRSVHDKWNGFSIRCLGD